MGRNASVEFSSESYARTVHCADVYVGDVIKQEADGTIVCAMRPAPRLWGKDIRPGDHLIVDPLRTPQTGDWVHIGEGIAGDRFKQYPCKESVLGVVIMHFPKAA
jgi:hypothetical protein